MNKSPASHQIAVALLCVIFIGIVVHTPLAVIFASIFPEYSLIFKSWKEILLICVAAITFCAILRDDSYKALIKNKFVYLILAYCLLHFTLLVFNSQGLLPAISGLMIDLRYVLFCLLTYIWATRYPIIRDYAIRAVLIGAGIVCGFAVLQVFILPYDILSYIGYNKNTIIPYLLVDNNYDFIRINSTLRGPNPLGAYAVIVIASTSAYLLSTRLCAIGRKRLTIVVSLLFAAFVALWASYSRGALIAGFFAVGVIVSIKVLPLFSRKYKIISFGGLSVFILVVLMNTNSYFVSHVLLHENPTTDTVSISNSQHIESLKEGVSRLAWQPLGGGIGSTGSASLLGSQPLIIENQYLFIAHESGWLGLAVFFVLLVYVCMSLWASRFDWLSLGLFASGLGLSLIGLFLPVWSDDTVSMIWWGLAGLVLAVHKRS